MDQVIEHEDVFHECYTGGGDISELSPYSDYHGFHSLFFRFESPRGRREFLYVKGNGEQIINPRNDHYWVGYAIWSFRRHADAIGRPWLLINGNAPQMKSLKLEAGHREQILDKGLGIFYFEPLYLCNESNLWPWIPNRSKELKLPELEWLQEFLELNQIPATSVKLFLNDYRMSELLQKLKKHTQFEVMTEDMFLHFQVHHLKRRCAPQVPTEFEKKFLSLNYRYEPIRELMSAYLFHLGDSHLSFFHKHDRYHFLSQMPFDPRLEAYWPRLKQGIRDLSENVPLTFDTENSRAILCDENAIPDSDGESNQRPQDVLDLRREKLYQKSFLVVVNESRVFTPCPQISEKTTDALLFGRPFVLNAGPRALEYLQNLGFKTFSKFWDESYDQEECEQSRVSKVLGVLDQVAQWSRKEINDLNQEMMPILLHNQKVLLDDFLRDQKKRLAQSF